MIKAKYEKIHIIVSENMAISLKKSTTNKDINTHAGTESKPANIITKWSAIALVAAAPMAFVAGNAEAWGGRPVLERTVSGGYGGRFEGNGGFGFRGYRREGNFGNRIVGALVGGAAAGLVEGVVNGIANQQPYYAPQYAPYPLSYGVPGGGVVEQTVTSPYFAPPVYAQPQPVYAPQPVYQQNYSLPNGNVVEQTVGNGYATPQAYVTEKQTSTYDQMRSFKLRDGNVLEPTVGPKSPAVLLKYTDSGYVMINSMPKSNYKTEVFDRGQVIVVFEEQIAKKRLVEKQHVAVNTAGKSVSAGLKINVAVSADVNGINNALKLQKRGSTNVVQHTKARSKAETSNTANNLKGTIDVLESAADRVFKDIGIATVMVLAAAAGLVLIGRKSRANNQNK